MAIAGGMDRQPMPDDCNGCGDDMVKTTICIQAVCTGMATILPRSSTPALAAPDAFAAAPDQTGAGLSGVPDPYPPKPTLFV